jgi:MFS family permease
VVAATLGVACGASPVPYASLGQLIGPIHDDLGWKLGDISLAITLYGISSAIMAPYVGALLDRHGLRRVTLTSLVLFGLSFACLGFTPPHVWAWWLAWAFAGLLAIGSGPLSWTRGINLWFFRQRGFALGLTLVGTSFTGIAIPQIVGPVIDHYGWRIAYPALAILPLCVALPVAWLLFREPRPEERPPQIASAEGLTGVTRAEALRTPRFWLLFVSILLIALAYGGIFIHLQQMLELKGFAKPVARDVVSTLSLAILIGRLGTGVLLDRIWAPLVTLPLLTMPALACVLLMQPTLSLQFAYVSALAVGLAAGAETDLIAYLAGRYFGMAYYGRIYGVLYLPFGIAAAISPAAYGWIRDATGQYDLALRAAMFMFLLGGLLPLGLGRYPKFDR